MPAHAQASGDTVGVTSCADTDNAGVVGWNVWLRRTPGDQGGDADWLFLDADQDGSTHDYVVSLSSSDTNRADGLTDMDFGLNFGDAGRPDTTNVTANLNGSWSALDANVDSDSPSDLTVSVDGLDGIFASNDYNSGGATITVTTGDCSTAFNVTVNP